MEKSRDLIVRLESVEKEASSCWAAVPKAIDLPSGDQECHDVWFDRLHRDIYEVVISKFVSVGVSVRDV